MYLIIDFGLTKLANKIKKQAWESSLIHIGASRHRRGFSSDKLGTGKRFGRNKAGKVVRRGDNRINIRSRFSLPELTGKPNSNDFNIRSIFEKEMIPDNKKYTDLRKVNDSALSESGYMGYKNTPNSYFEESIPLEDMIKSGKKIKVKPRVFL